MKDFFKAEDFRFELEGKEIRWPTAWKEISDVANAKLQKLIESWPVVWFNDDKTVSPYWEASSRQDKKHTHKARLAFIEPIEPCKHEPVNQSAGSMMVDMYRQHCKHCGVELKATWEAK